MSKAVFQSVFNKELKNLIEIKRTLGFKYEAEERMFHRLDYYFVERGIIEKAITKEICDGWCRKRNHEKPSNQNHRISALRIFCKYLNEIGIPAYVPPQGIVSHIEKYDSHVYTDDELQRFFRAVDKSCSVPSECPYRSLVMPLFFRILYATGMRVSELRLARVRDFRLGTDEGYIFIRNAKNHKDRIVPIPLSLLPKCSEFRNTIHKYSPEDEYFFFVKPGRPMTLQNLYHNFRRYLEKAGISHTGNGPRIHDFRITYCVNLLKKWTDEGRDLLAWTPYMRTMLGHEGFTETAYYLKLTMERYPYIRDQFDKSFPDIVEKVNFHDCEFY